MTADVSDPEQVHVAVRETTKRFGTIHGVFQLAGVPPLGLIQLKTAEMASDVMLPKALGTLVLDQAPRDVPLDFFVMFSSLSSVTGGGPSQVDYCAANAVLDAFARAPGTRQGTRVAISWGHWQWDAWQDG